MYSPSRKVRASIRRTILLIIISSLSSIVLVGTIVEFGINDEEQLTPTRSAGSMLNRSQMLLAQEILLEPLSFPCQSKRDNGDRLHSMYPLFIIVKTRAVASGNYFQRRMFTRTSWGREARALGIPVIYAVGRANDEQTQKMLAMENRIYHDILQFNFLGKTKREKKTREHFSIFLKMRIIISPSKPLAFSIGSILVIVIKRVLFYLLSMMIS